MKADNFMVDSEWWTLEDVYDRLPNSDSGEFISDMSPDVRERVEKCHAYLADKILKKNVAVYGVNTGFGSLANTRIPKDKLSELQYKILISHACGLLYENTSQERTFYYELLPSNQLELGLWLESERMLHAKIQQIGIDTQNEVVKEEKRQRVDKMYG
ncbi:MAG: aromatic amino acid lyase, partial [Flavobacteriales bacterium]|nr:aromatic amino acid lyase [Flavobacteriales bacterium]